MSIPIIDPEFRDLLPPLAADEFAKLEALILKDGCTSPIILWQGLIADGHNRFDICTRNKIGYQINHIVTADYPDRNAVMLWMLDNQGGRRNLADIDKISIATKKEAIIAAQAKERQAHGQTAPGKSNASVEIDISVPAPILTRKEAAKEAGVGQTKYDEGKVILNAVASGEAPKELLEQVRAGEVSVHKAASVIKDARKPAPCPKPDFEYVAPPEKEAKPPRVSYRPALGMEIVARAIAAMETIGDTDKQFEPAYQAMIDHCNKRLARQRK
jgi:hypothetical protein